MKKKKKIKCLLSRLNVEVQVISTNYNMECEFSVIRLNVWKFEHEHWIKTCILDITCSKTTK